MPLAADYPFLDLVWTMVVFFAALIWIWLLIKVFADLIFRRHDLSGIAKVVLARLRDGAAVRRRVRLPHRQGQGDGVDGKLEADVVAGAQKRRIMSRTTYARITTTAPIA